MKMVWCPETARKAYLDTVKSCGQSIGAPEFISSMAGGWGANLIVEAWSNNIGGGAIKNSIGLAIAARHSGGRHVCIVPNERARQDYITAMQRCHAGGAYSLPEVMVGDKAEELMERLNGIDFLAVHGGGEDYGRAFSHAKFGPLGAVLVLWKNAKDRGFAGFRWTRVVGSEAKVVRSTFLPIENGLDIAYVAGESLSSCNKSGRRKGWIKTIDQQSGEEHIFWR